MLLSNYINLLWAYSDGPILFNPVKTWNYTYTHTFVVDYYIWLCFTILNIFSFFSEHISQKKDMGTAWSLGFLKW